jgi:hypothetical protein
MNKAAAVNIVFYRTVIGTIGLAMEGISLVTGSKTYKRLKPMIDII